MNSITMFAPALLMISRPVPFVVTLLLLLLLAKVLGEIMEQLRQPAMIGEVLAGIILGPTLLGFVNTSEELKVISDLGVFLLVIMAGMEIDIESIRESIRGKNFWIALLGFLVPFTSGITIGLLFNLNMMLTVFLGLCISITALPVSIRILIDLGKLNTDVGQKIISAAIFNDIVSLLILGVILDIKDGAGNYADLSLSVLFTVAKLVVFTALIIFIYRFLQRAKNKMEFITQRIDFVTNYLKGKESLFAMVIVFVLAFASITEIVGLHFVIGAFFGGMLLTSEMLGRDKYLGVQKSISGITMGFLAPVFFANMGVHFNLFEINNISLLLIILLFSFISKILGGYLGGSLAGMRRRKSLTLGIGLNARGIMELVIANIALQNGFIDTSMFSILVLMGITTTVITPILLKRPQMSF